MKLVDNVIKADATLGVKVEPYDDTELRERVEALEEKPDKDTIYDDTALTERVTALENKPDKDTVYDDTAIKASVKANTDALGGHTVKSDVPADAKFTDTVYDDSDIKHRVAEFDELSENKADIIVSSASGSIASFPDGAESTAKELVVAIEPVQEGTGDPSPDNVRPISGWTGAKVTRTGKNLLDLSNLRKGNFDGVSSNTNVSFDEYQPIKGGQTYVWSSPFSAISGRYLRFYDVNKTELSKVNLYGTGDKTFSVPSNARYFRGAWYVSTGVEPTDIVADQIELGSTATDYEPYQGDTYDIAFPTEAGTVYGGTLDVASGKLVVDRISHVFTSSDVIRNNGITDMSTDSISPITRVSYDKSQNSSWLIEAAGAATDAQNKGKYSHGSYNGTNSGWASKSYHGYAASAAAHVFIKCEATASAVASYLDEQNNNGTPVQLVYPIATPITYQLTPQEITTLLGQNNIWADTGDTSVAYRADTKLYIDKNIDKKFTELQALILEN